MGRRQRKDHIDYYVACGLVLKKDNKGLYGFRLYDLEYDQYEILTVNAVNNVLIKYPKAIINLGLQDNYIGLKYSSSSNYAYFNKNGDLIKSGNKLLLSRRKFDNYLIIDNKGNVILTGIDDLQTWIREDLILNKNKTYLAKNISNDINFYKNTYKNFREKQDVLTVVGMDYLNIRTVNDNSIKDGNNIIEITGIKDVNIPNGILKIPEETSKITLNIRSKHDIKVIDLRNVQKAHSISISVYDNLNKICILFPSELHGFCSLTGSKCNLELKNMDNIAFSTFDLNESILNNEEVSIKLKITNLGVSCKLKKVTGVKHIKISSKDRIKAEYIEFNELSDLESLDLSKLELSFLDINKINYLNNLKVLKLRTEHGYFYGTCSNCVNLQVLELNGSLLMSARQNIAYNAPSLEKIILNVKFEDIPSSGYFFNVSDAIIKEIENNSNVPLEKLFSKEYLIVRNKFKDDAKIRNIYKYLRLIPIIEDNEFIGFQFLSFNTRLLRNKGDHYCDMLNNGIFYVPEVVKIIGYSSCMKNDMVQKLVLNGSVTIEDRAFSKCKKLGIIENSEYIENIGEYAFAGCEVLEEFICGDKLKEIKKGTFLMCSKMKKLHVSNSVKRFGDYSLYGCTSLKLEGNTKFNITDRTIFNKNYVFKLNNSEISDIALDICDYGIRLDGVFKFSELDIIRKFMNNDKSYYNLRKLRLKDTTGYVEKLIECIDNLKYYDSKLLNKMSVRLKSDIKSAYNENVRAGYCYLVMSKQIYNLLIKIKKNNEELASMLGI